MKMKECNEYLKRLFAGLEDPVLVVARDYRIEFMNRAAMEVAGLREGGEGGFCYQVMRKQKTPCHDKNELCPVGEVVKTGKPCKVLRDIPAEGLSGQVYEISASPVFDDAGEVVRVVEVWRNMTGSVLNEQLQTSEQRFRSILESTHNAVATIDAQGIIVDCNKAVQSMFGYRPDTLVGRPFTEITSEETGRLLHAALDNLEKTGEFTYVGKTAEFSGRKAGGEEFPIEVSLSTWLAGGGRYYGAIIRDVSERKTLETKLRQEKSLLEESRNGLLANHEELKRVFTQVEIAKKEWERSMDCVDEMVILVDADGDVQRCNRAFCDLTGKPFPEILQFGWKQLFTEHGLEESGKHGEMAGSEVFHRPSGRSFIKRMYSLENIAPGAAGAVISLHDVTERKKMTRELERKNRQIDLNRRKLQEALDEVSSLIQQVAVKKDFNVCFVNPNLKKCWESLGCDTRSCQCYGKEAMRCWQVSGTFCGGKEQGVFVEKYGDCRKCEVFQESATDPIYQIGEQFNNMMHILKIKNEELEKAYTDLKATQSQILQQEKMASIGQLAAGVAHEINNPVGFVTSNLGSLAKYVDRFAGFIEAQSEVISALQGDAVDALAAKRKELKIDFVLEDAGDLIDESLDGTERIRKIVQNLKNFSRVDQTDHKKADVNQCIEDTINIVWNELKYKCSLHKEYGDLPLTWCYPQQLNQVFTNLLVNAAQSIEKQGDITITTRHVGNAIQVSISDTGRGIPQENLSRLFEPFFTTKEIGKGTGLGLSIAYDIVTKKHNGAFDVKSEVGKGTTFTITIPVTEREEG